jgi:hypothetical protein
MKAAEKAAQRIKEEDEAEKKKAEAALVEKEKKNRLNQDWTITTDKLEDLETGEDKLVTKKIESKKSSPAEKPKDSKDEKPAPKAEAKPEAKAA